MAKIKWDPAATPLNNEHDGYTFQRNNYGFSMFPAGRNARKRYERQFLRMHPNQKAVTQWRNMPQSIKDQWALFASTFPQPSKKDPNIFLNGFECFVKRNYFCFLNHGIHSDFMLEPDLIVNEGEPITFAIKAETTAIECAELYIKNFGLLPEVGNKVLVYAAVYSEFTGHFYESINTYAIVEEIYIDSMQIAVYIPDTFNDVSVSVYLSKPVSHGVSYVGTKIRYMGCFTTKKFTELQDTPGSYTGNAGKVPAVKDDETGLEFVEGGGGGLTCEDLANCPTIQEMQEQINNLQEIIVLENDTSIPAVNYGLLYNRAIVPRIDISSADEWRLPTRLEIIYLYNYLGGSTVAGIPLKSTNPVYWLNAENNTNAKKFNGRGVGMRHGTSGAFINLLERTDFLTSTPYFGAGTYYYSLRYNTNSLIIAGINGNTDGISIRLLRPAPGAADGIAGTYIGNNGRIYRTITINEIEYMADNLAETKYRDSSAILEITDGIEWYNNLLPALCAYNNDWSNV